MRTWEDYKNHVKSISEKDRKNMENIEKASNILSSIIEKKPKTNSNGYQQSTNLETLCSCFFPLRPFALKADQVTDYLSVHYKL